MIVEFMIEHWSSIFSGQNSLAGFFTVSKSEEQFPQNWLSGNAAVESSDTDEVSDEVPLACGFEEQPIFAYQDEDVSQRKILEERTATVTGIAFFMFF